MEVSSILEYKNSIPGRKKGKCNGELFYVGVAPSTKVTMEGHGTTTGIDGGGQMPREVVGQCHSIVIWIERGKIVSVDAMATLVDSTWALINAWEAGTVVRTFSCSQCTVHGNRSLATCAGFTSNWLSGSLEHYCASSSWLATYSS